MKTVGIIANPASGRDIRRLIASGMTVSNQEKRNIIVRMLKAMDALGVERVEIMPETTHMGERLIRDYQQELKNLQIGMLDMPYIIGTQQDSLRAAGIMVEQDFSAIIVLGGDGTSRIVSKGCADVPLIPVSTGTNNVFPSMVEGTLVGMAAAAIATSTVTLEEGCERAPRLELLDRDNKVVDIALVDLVVVDASATAARAVWEADRIKEVYLAVARPTSIGLSSIGGQLHPLEPGCGQGLQVMLGEGDTVVTAPIAPGMLSELSVRSWGEFGPDRELSIEFTPCVIALDGEREVVLGQDAAYRVRICRRGPLVVDIERTLKLAAQRQFLVSHGRAPGDWHDVAVNQ